MPTSRKFSPACRHANKLTTLTTTPRFIDGVQDWGAEYEVASSDDPISLVDKTCISYSSDDDKKLRRRDTSLVANTTASKGCFGGLISCSTTEETADCDSDDSTSDTRRASTCNMLPAIFYNCDYLGNDETFDNLNENTNADTPSATFISICKNVRNYLDQSITTTPSGRAVIAGSNWMQLTYLPGSSSSNRNKACSAVSKACASTKTAMWPTAVQKASGAARRAMQGYSNFISCDEFPFNA